jgi:hypothetical protein
MILFENVKLTVGFVHVTVAELDVVDATTFVTSPEGVAPPEPIVNI